MNGACCVHGADEKRAKLFVGKHDGKRPLQRPTHRLQDNIKMDLEIGFKDVELIHLVQHRDQ